MKSTRFLLAACALAPAFACVPAFAAPDATPATSKATMLAPAAVPQIDAAAVALMNESAQAYAALPQLSQTFTVESFQDGTPQPDDSASGFYAYQKPGNARLEAVVGGEKIEFVTDGATLSFQNRPKKYQQETVKGDAIENVLFSMPSNADVPLSLLTSGRNPIDGKGAPKWQSARLDTKNGLPGVVLVGPNRGTRPPATFGFYLDPQTKLLARVEASAEMTSQQDGSKVLVSDVTKFAPNAAAAITPATFQYVPGPGIERFYAYDPRLVVGADPFALVGKTLNDDFVSLDKYKGRVVLLDFWATWCPPCRAEMPNVIKNYNNYHPWGFDIVGISRDLPDDEAKLRRFVTANKMAWPQILDTPLRENSNGDNYGVALIPFTLLIGKDGKIAAINPRDEELEPEIRAALLK